MSFNIKASGNYCIYTRVSTKNQANDEANGFDKQDKACEYYADKIFDKKETSINYYSDIGSTYNNKSKLKQQLLMLDELKFNSVILIHDVSRLGRNSLQVLTFLQKIKNASSYIISVTDNVCFGKSKILDKKFYHKIIDAEEKSDHKSMRMTKHIKAIKKMGGHIGRVSYGFSLKKINNVPKIVKNEEEQNNIKIIKKLLKTKSYDEIVIMLNRSNSFKRGKQWCITNIKSINLNKKIPKSNNSLVSSMKNLNV